MTFAEFSLTALSTACGFTAGGLAYLALKNQDDSGHLLRNMSWPAIAILTVIGGASAFAAFA